MTDIQIIGYHTCKIDGGWSYIRENAPFLSGSGDNQWLTQGYYFWTDTDHFAHKWGKDSYNGKYAILKCTLEIENNLLFDLVGSTEAQIYFKKLLTKFLSQAKKRDLNITPTVNAVISYWRDKSKNNRDIFPFVAIKAQDERKSKSLSFSGKKETLHIGIQRQQICLFEDGISCLKEKELIHPIEYKERNKLCQIYMKNP